MHLFYQSDLSSPQVDLIEEEFRHCIKVLRHQAGDQLYITDGKGRIAFSKISEIKKDRVTCEVLSIEKHPSPTFEANLYIAPTKQMERMEWMIEKLCELGVSSVSFIQTQASERPKIKLDRLKKKAISALKQSKGAWITQINEMRSFKEACLNSEGEVRLIAALFDDQTFISRAISPDRSIDVFIGPEGDFTAAEIQLAKSHDFVSVSLGKKVLRTETAGLYACSAIHLANFY